MLKKRGLLHKYVLQYALITFAVLFILSVIFAFKWSDNAARTARQRRAQRLADASEAITAQLDAYANMTTRVLTNPSLTPYMLAGASFNLYEAQKEFVKMMAYDDVLIDMTLYYVDEAFPYLVSTSSSFRRDQYETLCGLHADNGGILQWLDGLDGVGMLPARMARAGRSGRDVLLFSRVSYSYNHYNAILFCTLDSQALLNAALRAFDGLDCVITLQNAEGEALYSLRSGDMPSAFERYSAPVGAYPLLLSAVSAREPASGYMRELLVFLIPGVLTAAALGMALAIVLARRSYTPILDIVTQLPEAGQNAPRDELERIREAFTWYAREQRNLESRIREQNHLVGDAHLVQFLRGEAGCSVLSPDFKEGAAVRPALLQIDSLEEMRRHCSRREIVALQSRVRALLKKELPGLLCAIEDEEDGMVMLLPDAPDAEQALRRAQERTGKQLQITLSIALGDALRDFSLLPERLDALRDMLSARYVLGTSCLINSALHARVAKTYTGTALPDEKEIGECLRAGEQAAWTRLVNRYLDENARLTHEASRRAYTRFIEGLANEIRAAGTAGKHGDALFETLLLPLETRQEAMQRLHRVWGDAQRRLAFEQSVRGNRLRDDIVRYLNTHFTDANLSLQTLSDACGCSPVYASRYFKEKMGVTFSEYVDARRMRQAERLLCESDMLLKDIVLDIGYQDVNSFIRKFKRVNGITPIAYREANRSTQARDNR